MTSLNKEEVLQPTAIITPRGYILVEDRISKYKRWIKEAIVGVILGLGISYMYAFVTMMFGPLAGLGSVFFLAFCAGFFL